MKALFLTFVTALTLVSCENAPENSVGGSGGDSVGNGGDGIVLEFRKYGRDAYRLAKQNNMQSVDLQKLGLIVESADIVSTSEKLMSEGTERDALNYPAENKIVVNRARWQQIQSEKVKMALALHEFLLLMGANDSSYILSSKILNYDTSVLLEPEQAPPVPGFQRAVDILFVIDDSGSMARHQQKLQNTMQAFYDRLMAVHYLDFQIGVISTSIEAWDTKAIPGQLYGAVPIIHRKTPNAVNQLQQNVLLGDRGNASERPLDAIALSLSPAIAPFNTGFYRAGVPLEVIFITDAEDESVVDGINLIGLLMQKGITQSRFSGFVVEDENICPDTRESDRDHIRLPELIRKTKGMIGHLCTMNSHALEGVAGFIAAQPIP